ncbi:MAG TPA: DNA-binding domain-containing protein [Prolixibacteraceae bacterium]|nr:DNA-binding domain-containing protein [Prolixibacteraceae bacterium]
MKNILKAWLKKNPLTPDPNDYTATVVSSGSVGVDQIIDEIVSDGTELKRETILNIVTRFNNKAADLALSGYNVNTGLVYMRPIIKGAFYGKTWDPAVNSVYVSITQGIELREAVAETTVEILGIQSDPIEILSVTDQTTGKTDGTLTKGRNAELKGSYLKIAGDNEACGISFTNTATQEVTKLAATDMVLNEPSRLLIFVPATLVAGEYELTVTTQYSGSTRLLTQPRSASFGSPIVIA